MRLNENTKIIGQSVILVPYEVKHVEKYHAWMQNSCLQTLTASEPLTLQEEYENQKSWREDEDKITFIILCRQTYEDTHDEVAAMVGDTNLFLSNEDETNDTIAEAEIMIAEPSARGKGYGREAMLLLLKYAQQPLNIKKYKAIIALDNLQSIKLFVKIKFSEVSSSLVFDELTLGRTVTGEWLEWLDTQVTLNCVEYVK